MGWFGKRKKSAGRGYDGPRAVGHTVNVGSEPVIGRIVNRPEETWFVVEPTGGEFAKEPKAACEQAVRILVQSGSVSASTVNSRNVRVEVITNCAGQREFNIVLGL